MAMQGMLAAGKPVGRDLAEHAYSMADAMIAESENVPGGGLPETIEG